jgi:ubiquinone/menaquinone biosynthesis C-methylase UbiE
MLGRGDAKGQNYAMDPFDASVVGAAYDTVAEDYGEAFADDLLDLPLDRQVLDSLVQQMAAGECVLDLGCGPGQVGQYLAEHGLLVVGMDLAG